MQEQFVGTKEIAYTGTDFSLKYTPATIFSGTLPMFDINFINPMENQEKYEVIEEEKDIYAKQTATTAFYDEEGKPCVVYYTTDYCDDEVDSLYKSILEEIQVPNNIPQENKIYQEGTDIIKKSDVLSRVRYLQETYDYYNETTTRKIENTNMKFTEELTEYSYWFVENSENITKYTIYVSHKTFYEANSVTQIYQVKLTDMVLKKEATLESIARIMRGGISTWYNVMKEIALVGLLCVLVYIAIKGIISSSTEDKAKYKKMLFDWLTALVIVLTLHYIISFTLAITESVVNVFSIKILDEDGSDKIFSKLRSNIGNLNGHLENNFLNVVMYYTLIILTIKYTIIYMKRFIYIAFLTMLGPIIGLTYPLDKIKDGQAQAFSLWIKEFLFNVLMQPFHLIIYYVFVCGSIADFALNQSPIYALIVIAFLPHIEKMLKEMFGFNKGGSLGNLESAFGGAAVMNMMNSWGKKSSKGGSSNGGGSGSAGGNAKVRTANSDAGNPYEALINGNGVKTGGIPSTGEVSEGGTTKGGTSSTTSSLGSSRGGGSSSKPSSKKNSSSSTSVSGKTQASGSLPKQKKPGRIRNAFGKAKNKAQEIYNKPTIKGVRAVGGQVFTGAIRFAGEGTLRIAGAATLGTYGLAAGIATGEIENAFAGAAGGILAGNRVGKNAYNAIPSAVEKVSRTGRDIRDTFEEGRYGESKEEREARQEKENRIKEFRKSSKYQQLLEKFPDSHKKINSLVNAGITDAKKIRIAVESKYSTDNTIAYMHMAKQCPNNIFEDRSKFVVYLESHGIPGDKADEIYNAVRKLK